MKRLKYAVMGSGSAGHALAAILSKTGHIVRMYDIDAFKIKALDADAFLGWMRQKRGRSYAEMRVTREMIEEACRRASFDA